MPLVFQVDPSPDLAPYEMERARLVEAGVAFRDGSCASEAELLERATGADVLWLAWRPAITRSVLEALPNCRLVVRWGVGYDQIDTAAATELGVAVANAPTYGTVDVAEHAIALILAAERRIAWANLQMHAGQWPAAKPTAQRRILGRTLGLLGAGRIGLAVAERARGLGMTVIAHDPARPGDELRAAGVEPVDLDTFLARAEIISVHVPLSAATRHLVNADFLRRVRPDALLVNTSRGPVVDQEALIAALEEGSLAGAALDVYESEPLAPDSRLRSIDRAVLTPHMAAYSAEAWADLRAEMCSTTLGFLETGWAPTIVNPAVRDRLRPG